MYGIVIKSRRGEKSNSKDNKCGTESRKKGKNAAKRATLILLFFALAALSAALIANPEKYVPVCFESIALWAQCVLPALFPFMVVCAILTNSGIADKISKPLARVCGAVKLPPSAAIGFLMSITSGYPAGSRTVSQFYTSGLCDKEACEKLAFLCSTSGPVFLIGTVGAGMFGDGGIGAKIFAMHAVSVVLVAVAISLFSKESRGKPPAAIKTQNVLYESFYGAVNSALTAGAFIAFFYTAAEVAHDFYILYPVERLFNLFMDENLAKAAAAGLIEMTGGCAALAKCGGALSVPLAGFTVTFGGACVILQQLSFLNGAGVRCARFIAVKFIQGALCFALLLIPI